MEVTTADTMDNNATEFDHYEHEDHHDHHHQQHHHHHHHEDHGSHHMPMYFFTSYDNVIVLFDKWKITDVGTLMGSVVAAILLAILFELIKVLREYFTRKSNAPAEYSSFQLQADIGNKKAERQILKTIQTGMLTFDHMIQTLMHTIQLVIGYLLMLIFMGYNVWLCIAVVFGNALGYFLLGLRKGSRSIERKCVVERKKCNDPPCHEMTSCKEK